MRILVIGFGTLGQALAQTGWLRRESVDFVGRRAERPAASLDITDTAAVTKFFSSRPRFDMVINTAAMTDVDGCEKDPVMARRTNAEAVARLADECKKSGASLLHVSTNYVFSGSDERERVETDSTAPCSIYGITKLEGEWHALNGCDRASVVRTSWIFGGKKRDFVRHFLEKLETTEPLPVVADQVASLTYAKDLAEGLEPVARELETARAAGKSLRRTYHLTNAGKCTRFEMLVEMKKLLRKSNEIQPVPSEAFSHVWVAVRPRFSALSNALYHATFGRSMRPWREALADHLAQDPGGVVA